MIWNNIQNIENIEWDVAKIKSKLTPTYFKQEYVA